MTEILARARQLLLKESINCDFLVKPLSFDHILFIFYPSVRPSCFLYYDHQLMNTAPIPSSRQPPCTIFCFLSYTRLCLFANDIAKIHIHIKTKGDSIKRSFMLFKIYSKNYIKFIHFNLCTLNANTNFVFLFIHLAPI